MKSTHKNLMKIWEMIKDREEITKDNLESIIANICGMSLLTRQRYTSYLLWQKKIKPKGYDKFVILHDIPKKG